MFRHRGSAAGYGASATHTLLLGPLEAYDTTLAVVGVALQLGHVVIVRVVVTLDTESETHVVVPLVTVIGQVVSVVKVVTVARRVGLVMVVGIVSAHDPSQVLVLTVVVVSQLLHEDERAVVACDDDANVSVRFLVEVVEVAVVQAPWLPKISPSVQKVTGSVDEFVVVYGVLVGGALDVNGLVDMDPVVGYDVVVVPPVTGVVGG